MGLDQPHLVPVLDPLDGAGVCCVAVDVPGQVCWGHWDRGDAEGRDGVSHAVTEQK